MSRVTAFVATALLASALMAFGEASAQEPTAADKAGARKAPVALEEVVVRARRRDEALQDYAGAATVFDTADVEAIRLDGLEDVIQRIPNAHFEQRSGNAMNLWIRGAGTSTSGSATNLDTGVGLYQVDIYNYIQGSRTPWVLYDMESIQVYRGPQGSLYGRNAVGGAVAAFTARPTHELGGYLNGEFGDFNSRTIEGRVNVPLNEAFALRIS